MASVTIPSAAKDVAQDTVLDLLVGLHEELRSPALRKEPAIRDFVVQCTVDRAIQRGTRFAAIRAAASLTPQAAACPSVPQLLLLA
eukprot:m.143343 g.143343  ORF g.143343 m.143343 type:complete len:86 (-) comp17163_c0_seq1:91-348(-)